MNNYIELSPQIMAHESWITDSTEVNATLDWLDEHPDQVPGRTITDSELETITHDLATYEGPVLGTRIRAHLAHIGVSVVPDPEPTNAEKATADLEAWGMLRSGALELGPWLAGQGWVKAPEGESDE